MSRCTKFAGNADGITWECTRERDHDGPCAMALTGGDQCAEVSTWTQQPPQTGVATLAVRSLFYQPTTAHTQCTLIAGHDGEHRGEVGWR